MPELDRHARTFLIKLEKAYPGCRITAGDDGGSYGPLEIIPQNSGFGLAYSNRGANLEWRLSLEQTGSGCRLILSRPGREPEEALLPNSSVPEVWVHEFQ